MNIYKLVYSNGIIVVAAISESRAEELVNKELGSTASFAADWGPELTGFSCNDGKEGVIASFKIGDRFVD